MTLTTLTDPSCRDLKNSSGWFVDLPSPRHFRCPFRVLKTQKKILSLKIHSMILAAYGQSKPYKIAGNNHQHHHLLKHSFNNFLTFSSLSDFFFLL